MRRSEDANSYWWVFVAFPWLQAVRPRAEWSNLFGQLFSTAFTQPVSAAHLLHCITEKMVTARTCVLFDVLAIVFKQLA